MGTPLTGSTVASTYTGLLKTSDNSALTSVLKAIGDGSGIDSALQVSTAAVNTTGDFSVGANKLTVAAASGNTVVGGTLGVTGATNLSTLTTSGAASIGGALSISGGLSVPGNLSVTGTSTLTGATSVASTLAVTGATSLSSLSTSGAATIGTTLGVTGASTLASLGVTNAATIGSTLAVTGDTTLGNVDVTGDADIFGSLSITGSITTGAINALGQIVTQGNLTANANTIIGNAPTDLLTINANVVTLPNVTSETVDLANDKVLITDASDSSKVKVVPANQLGITASNAPQCVQTLYRDVTPQGAAFVGTNTGSGVEITVLNTTITPRSSSSKVLVSIAVNYAGTNIEKGALRITRNGVEIGSNNIGSSLYGIAPFTGLSPYSSNFFNSQFIQILDSPSTTSAVTYKLHLYSTTFGGSTPSMWLNRTNQDVINNANSASDARVSSSMTLQEYFA